MAAILTWMQKGNAKTETGLPMDMKTHAFMTEFLMDHSQYICSMKAAQITFTTHAIFKSLFEIDKFQMDAIYTMPSAADSDVFVSGKVNRILFQNSPMFGGRVKNKDSVRQKQIGQNMIYYRGTKNEQQAISVSADLLIFDEYDRSDQRIIEMYSSRLQHSKHKKIWLFSNPSYENNGVHRFWVMSDQKHWFITCPHCQYEQFLNFPDNISFEQEEFVCKKCKGILSPDDRRRGRWRKKYLNREWSGYWINLLMLPTISAKYIISEFKNKTPEFFANFIMGMPYIGGDAKLSKNDFYKNFSLEPNKQEGRIVIGVDPGIPIWYTIGNQDGIFNYGKTTDWEHLCYLMDRRFKDAIMVIDIGGGGIEPRKMLERYPGRVYLCQFNNDRKRLNLITWGEGDERGFVKVDRNAMIQLVMDEFRDSRVILNGRNPEEYDEMWSHFNNVWRTTVIDKQIKIEKYIFESNKPDHLLFSTLYWRVGMDRYGFGGGTFLNEDDDIESKKGYILSPTDSLDDGQW